MSENCPTCNRAIEGARDYARILVVEFNRTKFPDLIGSNIADIYENNKEDLERLARFTSPEVVQQLKTSSGESISHCSYLLQRHEGGGRVFYVCAVDITQDVQSVLVLPQIDDYLSQLEKSVGNEVASATLTPPKITSIGSDFVISHIEAGTQNGHRKCGIHLTGKWISVMRGFYRVLAVNTDIATLVYDGKLNI